MNTQDIRDWVILNKFDPVRGHGIVITLRSGDVHDDIGLDQRHPMVCSALETVHQHTRGVLLLGITPGPDVTTNPPRGANVWYNYQIQ